MTTPLMYAVQAAALWSGLLILMMLAGALMLSASSVVSKTLIPGAIFPIGVVTSLIGMPFFISLILGSKKNAW